MQGMDRPREACGVFGVMGVPEAAAVTVRALFALQHRGQESAGVAVARDGVLKRRVGMGLVADVFPGPLDDSLAGDTAIGHVRYSTTGESRVENAQPLLLRGWRGEVALAHNGNLVNAVTLRRHLETTGSIFQTTTDTEVLAHLFMRSEASTSEEALVDALRQVQGGYAFLVLTGDTLFAVRDPAGIRPLVLGELLGRYVVASESCALDAVGARLLRDVAPGELLVIRDRGRQLESRFPLPRATPAPCVFEYIYFARPDSELEGQNVHQVRRRLGRELARESPAPADLVIGVPDSSVSAAAGYAEALGLPYEMGLVKNRYVGRTFIQPTQALRQEAVRLKLNAIPRVVGGKRVVLVDDSIVRGTTSRHLVQLLRDAGAKEVHLRIASPPYRHPCHYGIDTSAAGQLLARGRDVEDMRAYLGADSLAFLSPEGVARAVGTPHQCMACFTGRYPVPLVDEGMRGTPVLADEQEVER